MNTNLTLANQRIELAVNDSENNPSFNCSINIPSCVGLVCCFSEYVVSGAPIAGSMISGCFGAAATSAFLDCIMENRKIVIVSSNKAPITTQPEISKPRSHTD